jgi:hypothetical protein
MRGFPVAAVSHVITYKIMIAIEVFKTVCWLSQVVSFTIPTGKSNSGSSTTTVIRI